MRHLFLLAGSAALALSVSVVAAEKDKVLFRNASKETRYVVTDVGENKARRNFRLEAGGSEAVDVGTSYLVWCSYSSSAAPPCTPSEKASGGKEVVLK